MRAPPVADSSAPSALIELAQPRPAAPLLPHGHAIPAPSPAQNVVTGPPAGAS